MALNKAHVLALNTAHVLRLNKADVLALNKANVLRLNTKICPVFTANTKEPPHPPKSAQSDGVLFQNRLWHVVAITKMRQK